MLRLMHSRRYAFISRSPPIARGWRGINGLLLGYVVAGQVRGLGELKPIGNGSPRAAELAVSVERPFQNRGIGTALLRRLVVSARNRLIDRIHMVCLIENGRAVRMARRLDGVLRFRDGEAEAVIEPPWPTPWTWLEEALLEFGGAEVEHPETAADPKRTPALIR